MTVMLNEGAVRVRDYLNGNDTTAINPYVLLWTDTFGVPANTFTFASFHPTTLSGYSDQPWHGLTWTGGVSAGDATATATSAILTLAAYGGADTILNGYLIYDKSESIGLWADTISPAYTVPHAGSLLAMVYNEAVKLAT
jgi:hypothetical protein